MGATPMIGQNDVPGETFSLSDAHALVSFAHRMHLARVSMWSANRDTQCGAQVLDSRSRTRAAASSSSRWHSPGSSEGSTDTCLIA